jgi:hypothetical protein
MVNSLIGGLESTLTIAQSDATEQVAQPSAGLAGQIKSFVSGGFGGVAAVVVGA